MNPLRDLLPPRLRGILYVVAFLISMALGAWQAADGNTIVAVSAFFTALTAALAGSNLNGPER